VISSQKNLPNFCRRYGVIGDELLKTRGKVVFEDGSFFEQVVDGSLRFLRLNFNKTVDLFSVTVQLRFNSDVRVITYDDNGTIRSRFNQIPAGKKFPLETELIEHPPITKVMLQGFDAQLTYDEITYVNITVCAHNCRFINNCFGACAKIEKDFGCLECQCPAGSPSSGCSGIPELELKRLTDSAKKQVNGCQFDVGYKRLINEKLNIDDCVAFNYPKCDTFKDIVVPKKRVDCLKYCY